MSRKQARVSPAEHVLLRALATIRNGNSKEVFEACEEGAIAYKTVKSRLDSLVEKGFVKKFPQTVFCDGVIYYKYYLA